MAAGNFQQAYEFIKRMQGRRIMLGPYLDSEMVDVIAAQLGVPPARDDEDAVEEDIAHD
jgi:hypothetical protein